MSRNYQRELEAAVAAARQAGAHLLAEFHRPGGPRGTFGKCPADTQAEEMIRARLLGAFPDYGYRGEETGEKAAAAGEAHQWLVDPNDGTTSFQRGRRGPAVSIGLVCDGAPVLGVVYAFAAPDDDGDLMAFAEGCGPMTRNARPVEREPLPQALGPLDVVLLSQGADRKAEVNLAAIAPARFRAIPSIAYRLALLAAGEGAACVSLHAPGDWDFAAGHALLRAAGGVLLDERGAEVKYPAAGRVQTQMCFGGAAEVCAQLARQDWRAVQNAPYQTRKNFDVVRLEKGRSIADAGVLRRAHGCLLGQLAGDALGSAVEGHPAEMVEECHPGRARRMADGGLWETLAGQPTDDSEMALMLARTLVRDARYSAEAAAEAYAEWFRSGPFDCGNTIRHALAAVARERVAPGGSLADIMRRAANAASQANGSLMRISPLGIWGWQLAPDELAAHARADSELTHPHAVCRDACAALTIAIAHAIRTGAGPREVFGHTMAWARGSDVDSNVKLALMDAAVRAPAQAPATAGWVLHAFRNAFYQLLHAPNFEEGVVATVLAGGDTDTNAAIAGALLGAVCGREAIPAAWRRMVLSCRAIAGRARNPRPAACWPADALEIAECLLLCGQDNRAGGTQRNTDEHG
jgi:ADP-ribosylglycohydrolase/fructose-1,6-bisphosphatase/inositol monophosphatase family enzyme